MAIMAIGNECDFVDLARSSYESADHIVRTLDKQRKCSTSARRNYNRDLKSTLSTIEDYLWQALARDYPNLRYRRQGQTVVVSYTNSPQVVYINPGEVYKIKAWGHNEYYEALDTINRLQSQMYSDTFSHDRRWKDDWNRLDKQINTIYERNCRGREEYKPGPVIIVDPPTCPGPDPYFRPGILEPCPVLPMWSLSDQRNWSVANWSMGGSTIPGQAGVMWIDAPMIVKVDGRELVYYKPKGIIAHTKLVWLFHGAGSSARSWFTEYEKIKYVKKFLDAGYAVAAYDSYNRVSRKWTPTVSPDTNREIMGLKACQDYLASVGILRKVCTAVASVNPYTGETKVSENCGFVGITQFGVGMDNGGAFVPYAAGPMGLRAISIHNAAGYTQVMQNSTTLYQTPTIWNVSAEDIVVNNSDANTLYNWVLTNRPSVNVAYFTSQASKMTSAMFDDIPGVSTVVADAIISGMVSGGFLNSGGTLTNKYSSAQASIRDTYLQSTIPLIVQAAFSTDTASYQKYANDIIDQMKINFGDHQFAGWQRTESAGNLVLTDRDLAFFTANA